MNATYHYTVLRLATDKTRGEVVNAGIVLFHPPENPRVIALATLNKLRALDASWNSQRLAAWANNIETILRSGTTMRAQLQALGRFGFCNPDAVGMFIAENEAELAQKISSIKSTYVANKAKEAAPKREKRTKLQTALRDQFSRMHVLGHEAADIANHLVVPNMPVPTHPELKNDFVYKNGVYRITQTLDYNVAPDSLHNKLQEACVKSTAADLAARDYGKDTQRYAVVDIPEAYSDAADAHIDLLLAQGFKVFHFRDAGSMSEYLRSATPAPQATH